MFAISIPHASTNYVNIKESETRMNFLHQSRRKKLKVNCKL